MITENQLIGKLEKFPIEVVKRMLECQVEQGNVEDATVFQRKPSAGKKFGGFDWWDTIEDEDFWYYVIVGKDFGLFFGKYPT